MEFNKQHLNFPFLQNKWNRKLDHRVFKLPYELPHFFSKRNLTRNTNAPGNRTLQRRSVPDSIPNYIPQYYLSVGILACTFLYL